MFFRFLILASLVAAVGTTGCSGDGPSKPDAVEVDAADYAYVMPNRIKGGVVSMRFRNTGKEPHEFAFVRLGPGHTVDDALESGDDLPWLTDVAGPPLLTPGAEITITRTLEPGTYAFFCALPDRRGRPHVRLGMKRQFTIVGDSGADLPAPDAVITADAKRFDVPELAAGTQTIELRNASGFEREFILWTLNQGKTKADLARWGARIESTGRLPDAPAPVTALGAMQSIPSGTSVYLTVDLEAGRTYHLEDDESGIEADFTPR